MKINGLEVTAQTFAFDGCHKIYLLENEAEEANARELGYNIYPIHELRQAYEDSCGLRFISNWPLIDDNFVSYVGQGEDANFEDMQTFFVVLYRQEKVMSPADAPFSFRCQANDTDHAEEQCINAYPDAEVVWVWKGTDAQAALDDYWNVCGYTENQL